MIETGHQHNQTKEEILDRLLNEKIEAKLKDIEHTSHEYADEISRMHHELDSMTTIAHELQDHLQKLEEQRAQAEAAKLQAEAAKLQAANERNNARNKPPNTKNQGDSKIIKSKDDTDIDKVEKGQATPKNPRGKGLARNQSEAGLGLGRRNLGKGGENENDPNAKTVKSTDTKTGVKPFDAKKTDEQGKPNRPQTTKHSEEKKPLFNAPKTTKNVDNTKISFGKIDEEKKEDEAKPTTGTKSALGKMLGGDSKKDSKSQSNLNKSFAGHEFKKQKDESKTVNKSTIEEKHENENKDDKSKGGVKGLTSPKGVHGKPDDKYTAKKESKATEHTSKKDDKKDTKKDAHKDNKKDTKAHEAKKDESKAQKPEEPQKISEEKPEEKEQPKVEEEQPKVEEEQPKVEEKQPKVEKEEPSETVNDEKKEESKVEEQPHKTEEHTNKQSAAEDEGQDPNGPAEEDPNRPTEENPKGPAEEDPNGPAEDDPNGAVEEHKVQANGPVNSESLFEELEKETGKSNLKSLLTEKGKTVEQHAQELYAKYDKKEALSKSEVQRLEQEGVKEEPSEQYTIKASTKNIIEMVEKGWVEELKDKPEADEKVYRILDLFFRFKQESGVPDFKKQPAQFWTFSKDYLSKYEDNFVAKLSEMEGEVEKVPIQSKLKIEKIAKEDLSVLNPTTFDTIDALSGVMSFMLKELTEHMGIIQAESKKSKGNNSKVLKYNKDKAEYYEQKKHKVQDILKSHNISA